MLLQYPLRTYLNKKNIAFGIFRQFKALQQLRLASEAIQKRIFLILGCQRSGTSMIYWIFERDLRTKIFRESSILSSNDHPKKLRLNPLPQVQSILDQQKAPIIVLKPLVESQRAPELLEYLRGSVVLWMYRHYRDVASSNIKAFGIRNGIEDLRSIVLDEPNNWRSERVSADTRAIMSRYFSEDINPYDAAALFWFARNQLFFELNLHENPKVMLCRYEDLCRNPADIMRQIYAFANCTYPGDFIVKDVHFNSVGRGKQIELSPEIDRLCAELFKEMRLVGRCDSTGP